MSSPSVHDPFEDLDLDFLNSAFLADDELADCFLSETELQALLTPSTEVWKDFLCDKNEAVITIDSAKKHQWKLAKDEITHVKMSMVRLLGVEDASAITSMKPIIDFIIGPNSKVGKFLREELDLDEETYLKFMSTLCTQAAYRATSTQLFHPLSSLKRSLSMSEEEYNKLWETMSEKKKLDRGESNAGRREVPLWQTLEGLTNEILREVSILRRAGTVAIALDDDKIWMSMKDSIKGDLFNLKYTTHTQANRKGLIAHTAVSTSLNIPLGIAFEKTMDTTLLCFKRILHFLFGQDGTTNLRNVSVHSDRGYMIPSLVFEFLISSGAEVVGTVKRMAQCWPFTYEQKLDKNDKRTLIDPKGAATLFLKWCKAGPKYLFASAFRNGTGRVATAISTMHTQHQWEGVALNSNEAAQYKRDSSSLKSLFFVRVDELDGGDDRIDKEKKVLDELIQNQIVPYTLRQGTADWHYMRKFSLTSSQAHKSFNLAFPKYKNNEAWIAVARYLYGENYGEKLLGSATNPAPAGAAADLDSSFTAPESIHKFINKIIPEEGDQAMIDALNFLKKYVGALAPATDEEDGEVADEPDGEKVDEAEAKRAVGELASDVKKKIFNILSEHVEEPAHRKNSSSFSAKELILWLQQTNPFRNYWFYKASGLKAMITAQGMSLGTGRKTIDDFRKILAGPRPTTNTQEESEGSSEELPLCLTPELAATKAILERSFLPHQKGKKREHCTLGHRLELPILKNWMKVIAGEDSPFPDIRIKGVYTAGLAAKKGAEYAKDSIDFVVTLANNEDDDEDADEDLKIWGFEAKGRVTARTAAQEEANLHFYNNPHVFVPSDDVHKEVASEGERFQVLQHAFVYNFDNVVLAISDSQSTLIRSTIISFSTQLKEDFGKVLSDIKEFSLYWAYPSQRNARCLTVPNEILKVARDIKTINGDQTLQGTANVWHSLVRLDKPFPSFTRLLPAIYAFWNAVKGGSDTTTKLMDDCILRVPKAHLNAETVACTRLISILFVFAHRLHQVATSQDTSEYENLEKYRKAASSRSTYHVSLLRCRDAFSEQLKEKERQQAAAAEQLNNNNNTHQTRNTTSTHLVTPPRRRNPTRVRIDGQLPSATNFGAMLSAQTPMKMSVLAKHGKLSDDLQEMIGKCSGIPMKAYPIKYGKCNRCHLKTAWYCAGCKRWLCMERRALEGNNKQFELYSHTVRGNDKTFVKMCYHQEHETNWEMKHYLRNETTQGNN